MFCENCGSKLAEDAVFCTECGTPVTAMNAESFAKEVNLQNGQRISQGPTPPVMRPRPQAADQPEQVQQPRQPQQPRQTKQVQQPRQPQQPRQTEQAQQPRQPQQPRQTEQAQQPRQPQQPRQAEQVQQATTSPDFRQESTFGAAAGHPALSRTQAPGASSSNSQYASPGSNVSNNQYASPGQGSRSMAVGASMTYGEYLISLLLTAVPLVGLAFLVKWAFLDKNNPNKANFARAILTLMVISLILSIAWFVYISAMIRTMYH